MNNKFTCHKAGTVFIKCTKCDYSWNVPVVEQQEVEVVCPNCGNDDGSHITCEHRTMGHVDIPEFMSKPKQVVTIETHEYHKIIHEHCKVSRHYGYQQGLSTGICIGLIILGIVLFFLFAPITALPV